MRLSDAWAEHRAPHLVTVTGGHAHVVPVTVEVADGVLRVPEPGRRTRAAVDGGGTAVSLVWSPVDDGGYSLIVDGMAVLDGPAALDGTALLVTPVRAVRHRPATTPADGPGCTADCVELDPVP